MYELGAAIFSKLRVYAVYSNRRLPSLFGEHCEILQTAHMANFEENIEEMGWGQLEKRRRWPAGTAGRRQLAMRR